MNGIDVWLAVDAVPEDIVRRAITVTAYAKRVERDGAGPGSLTDAGLRYSVVDGRKLMEYEPILDDWIMRNVPVIASALVGHPLRVSPDMRTAINVNVLSGRGEEYEPHIDPCPYSALIFCSGDHKGGEWVAQVGPTARLIVEPTVGALLVFRGSIPHAVYPLEDESTRVSVPVALYPLGTTSIERDPELDAHIFGETA